MVLLYISQVELYCTIYFGGYKVKIYIENDGAFHWDSESDNESDNERPTTLV